MCSVHTSPELYTNIQFQHTLNIHTFISDAWRRTCNQKMHASVRRCMQHRVRRCMQHRVYALHASSEQAWRWAGTWPRNCCRSRSSRSQMGTCAFSLAAPAAAIKGGLSPYRRAFCGESTHSRAVDVPAFAPAGRSCRPSTHTSVYRLRWRWMPCPQGPDGGPHVCHLDLAESGTRNNSGYKI